MRWIEFDVAVARALADQCVKLAQLLRGQAWTRSNAKEGAMQDFYGPYATLFFTACQVEAEDRGKLAAAFDDLADDVVRAIEAAEREEARLEAAERQRVCTVPNSNKPGLDSLVSPPPSWPRLETIEPVFHPVRVYAHFVAQRRDRLVAGHSGEKVGARPQALRAFTTYAEGANSTIASGFADVAKAWLAFEKACAWLEVGPLLTLQGAQEYLEENRIDAAWAKELANAFDAAGGAGVLSELELSILIAKVDPRHVQDLLTDPSLTPEDLAKVVEGLAQDPRLRPALIEYIQKEVEKLGPDSNGQDFLRASALLDGVATSPPTSAALITALGAAGLIDRISMVGRHTYVGKEGSREYANSLREVFRSGEPYLAEQNPELSRKLASDMVDFIQNPDRESSDPINDTYALSFLLFDSKLSTPFLLTMGSSLESLEKKNQKIGVNWRLLGNAAHGMALLFPAGKMPAAFDPMVSYMHALGRNPEAASRFFSEGGNERNEYWIERRLWSHDKFEGLSIALNAAITEGDNLGTLESAKLASSTLEYLANRNQGATSTGERLDFIDEEKVTRNSLSSLASQNLARILGIYMPSIDETVDGGKPESSMIEKAGKINRPDLGEISNAPYFKIRDLQEVTRAIVADDKARDILRHALSTYQDLHFSVALDRSNALDAPEILRRAIETDAKLEGFFIDQIGEADIAKAKERDDVIREWTSKARALTNEIPVSKIPGIGSFIQHLADYGLDYAEAAIVEEYAQSESSARTSAEEMARDALINRKRAILEMMYEKGFLTEGKIAEIAAESGYSPEEVENFSRGGFPDPKQVSDSVNYERFLDSVAFESIDFGQYQIIFEQAFRGYFGE